MAKREHLDRLIKLTDLIEEVSHVLQAGIQELDLLAADMLEEVENGSSNPNDGVLDDELDSDGIPVDPSADGC